MTAYIEKHHHCPVGEIQTELLYMLPFMKDRQLCELRGALGKGDRYTGTTEVTYCTMPGVVLCQKVIAV